MPALEPRFWTAAELQALPDVPTQRYECVDGTLLVSRLELFFFEVLGPA